jgi:hypothetical protein
LKSVVVDDVEMPGTSLVGAGGKDGESPRSHCVHPRLTCVFSVLLGLTVWCLFTFIVLTYLLFVLLIF